MIYNDFPEIYGIKATEPRMAEHAIKAELDKGKVLICAMGQVILRCPVISLSFMAMVTAGFR